MANSPWCYTSPVPIDGWNLVIFQRRRPFSPFVSAHIFIVVDDDPFEYSCFGSRLHSMFNVLTNGLCHSMGYSCSPICPCLYHRVGNSLFDWLNPHSLFWATSISGGRDIVVNQ